MKKGVKIALIVALAAIVLGGGVLAVIGAAAANGRIVHSRLVFDDRDAPVMQERTLTLDPGGSVRIRVTVDDLSVGLSPDSDVHLTCYDTVYVKNEIVATPDSLILVQEGIPQTRWLDLRRWFFHWSASTGVQLLLPAGFCGELDLSSTTGDIDLEGLAPARLAVGSTTGALRLNGLAVDELSLAATTGDITLDSVDVAGSLRLASTTGRKALTGVTARSLDIGSSTGDILLVDVAADSIDCRASSGAITLTDVGVGALDVTATTGDVRLKRLDADSVRIRVTTGSVTGTLRGDADKYRGALDIDTNTGDVRLGYEE